MGVDLEKLAGRNTCPREKRTHQRNEIVDFKVV